VSLAYLVAAAAAVAAGWGVREQHPLVVILVADLVGTFVIFAFSVALNNSSVYDPYWSVAPLALGAYLLAVANPGVPVLRQALVLGVIALWGLRLTWSWARGWPGLHHEDWRYVDIRHKTGRLYWPASLVSIHLLPTLWVFGGMLSAWVALTAGTRPLGLLDILGLGITVAAVIIEATADRQLDRFKRGRPTPEAILESGLWRYSRHPNYFGELSFWWGLYLFALAADPARWYVVVGPVALLALFLFISLPFIERRMLARRPHYAERRRRVSALVPWPPRR
jgi:steroid 5-alpha reductase family enzyme